MLINQKHVRERLLSLARENRAHEYTSVSKEALAEADRALELWALRKVASQPSKGKTIR